MQVNPDFGFALMTEGADRNTDIFIPAFTLLSITVLGAGRFSSTTGITHHEVVHAVTLDFDIIILRKILDFSLTEFSLEVRKRLNNEPRPWPGATIFLTHKCTFEVTARLGAPQNSQADRFVPLCVTEVAKMRIDAAEWD